MPSPTTGPHGTPVLDSFSGGNGDPGAGWSSFFGGVKPQVASGVVIDPGGSGWSDMYWNVGKVGPRCEVGAKIPTMPTDRAGVFARLDPVDRNGYIGGCSVYDSGAAFIRRIDAGTEADLSWTPSVFSAGDYFYLCLDGSTIELWRWPSGGSAWALVSSVVDTTYPGEGYLGLQVNNGSLDNFGGGGIDAPVNTALPAISGALVAGARLQCSDGTWTNSPTLTYQWQRDQIKKSGVYRGSGPANGPDLVDTFAAWSGKSIEYASDFLAADNWTTISAPLAWLAAWHGRGYRMVYGVPMFPAGGSLAAGATGAYNAHFETLAANLLDHYQGDAILRLGWEFNGSWYPWSIGNAGDATNFVAFWIEVVTAMRAVAPDLEFDWNPAYASGAPSPELSWPGDAYVDHIGADVYDQNWSWSEERGNYFETDPALRWQATLSGDYGLMWQRDFAAAHGKPMSFPEWGVALRDDGHGGGDCPEFIAYMLDWIRDNDVSYHSYFEFTAGDGDHYLEGGNFPLSAAAFLAAADTILALGDIPGETTSKHYAEYLAQPYYLRCAVTGTNDGGSA